MKWADELGAARNRPPPKTIKSITAAAQIAYSIRRGSDTQSGPEQC